MSEEKVIRVALADDQRILVDGLKTILDAAPDLTVVGEAEDGEGAVRLAEAESPDVFLVDIRMPRLDGVAATGRIKERVPECRVLLLTTYDLPEAIVDGLKAGASGYILKDCSAEELIGAVRAVASGRTVLQSQAATDLLAGLGAPEASARKNPDAMLRGEPEMGYGLTNREAEVLGLMAEGWNNREIASALYVGEATVKTHVNHIFSKLGVRERARAIALARRLGLLQRST